MLWSSREGVAGDGTPPAEATAAVIPTPTPTPTPTPAPTLAVIGGSRYNCAMHDRLREEEIDGLERDGAA